MHKGGVDEGDADDRDQADARRVDARLLVGDPLITGEEEDHPAEEEGLEDVEEAFLADGKVGGFHSFEVWSVIVVRTYDKEENADGKERLRDEGLEEGAPEARLSLSKLSLPVSRDFVFSF